MSTLRVNNLTAVGGTGTITVPTGNQVVQTGAILQVVSTTKTDTFATSSTSNVDITGFSVSITPKFSSSKVLVIASMNIGGGSTDGIYPTTQLVRDSTAIYLGDAAGSRTRASTGDYHFAVTQQTFVITFLDSPNTTSATTYKVQMRTSSGSSHMNRSGLDTDNSNFARTASSITVMEVAG